MPILDSIRGFSLGLIDWINIATNPFSPFSRDISEVDKTPLNDRAALAWRDIQGSWLHGPNREFYWHMSPNDLGDMAMWQGLYVGACAFKRDRAALDRAIDGLSRLQYLGGNSRLCRGAGEVGGPQSTDPSRKYHVDGNYVFTDDCSESSLIGYLFGLWSSWMVCGSPETERRIAQMVNDLSRQVHADGEVLLNQDGTEAEFGHLRPGLLTAPIRISALACLYLLADITGDCLPEDKRHVLAGMRYRDILDNHSGALLHPETHFLWVHPWYQDMLAYIVLAIQSTMSPQHVRADFRAALRRQARKNRHEGNAFYAYMLALGAGVGEYEMSADASATLREFNISNAVLPSCKNPGAVTNSEDAKIDKFWWGIGSKRKYLSREPIPVHSRPPQDIVWQRCPYTLDGSESARYNYMDFALAYYMGSYLHLL